MKVKYFIFAILILLIDSANVHSGWNLINTGTNSSYHGISFVNQSTGFLCGWGGVIVKTTNGGNNWFTVFNNGTTGLQTIKFIDANTGWAIGQSGTILKSTNSGNNWFQQSSSYSSIFYGIAFINSNTGWIVGQGGICLKTTNSGLNWNYFNLGTLNSLTHISFANALTGWVSGDNNTILKTTNSGTNWFSQTSPLIGQMSRFSFIDANTGWLVGTNGLAIKTTNSGINWISQQSNTTAWLTDVCFVNSNYGWAVGNSGTIINTTNGGTTWTTQNSNTSTNLRATHFVNSTTGFAIGYNGLVLKTTNGGIAAEPPSAPTLIAPQNNSVNQSLTPLFSWNPSSYATNYTVQISTTPNFISITDSSTLSNTNYTPPSGKLVSATTYFWRVRSSNIYGTSSWSSVWYFATTAGPSAPTLISPANQSSGITLTPNMQWSSVSGAHNYTIQISPNSNFSTILDSITLNSTNRIVPSGKLNINSLYYWRVRASNTITSGPWSLIWSFTTIGLPTTPNLIYPANGALGISTTPTLDWSNALYATQYKVEISTISSFQVITDSATISASQYQVPNGKLQNLITYFWRVKSLNQYGSSAYTSAWMFTVYPDNISLISSEIPTEFKLFDNYPNPFNPETNIKFNVSKNSSVKIEIFDISGRSIEHLIDNILPPGSYEVKWNATKYSSGFYFIKMISSDYTKVIRTVLLK